MINFNDLLKKLNIREIDKEILIDKIAVDDINLQLFLYLKSRYDIEDVFKKEFENNLRKHLSEFDVKVVYSKIENKYNSIEELVKEEVVNYLPSAKAWIKDIRIVVDYENNIVDISSPDKIVHHSMVSNGLKTYLEDKVKCFGNYNIQFLAPDRAYTCDINISAIIEEENNIRRQMQNLRPKEKEVKVKKSDNDNYTYGKKSILEFSKLSNLVGSGKVSVCVDIFKMDIVELKNNDKVLIQLYITDYTNSYIAKLFLSNKDREEFFANVKVGNTVIITGNDEYDNFSKSNTILVKYLEISEREIRKDLSENKRVELRLHTKMSAMNGVTSFFDFAKRAKYWGMDSLAITDVADVQGFPEAMEAAKKYDLKLIYGLDGNFVDDDIQIIKDYDENTPTNSFVVFDIETTGFSSRCDEITEIGAVKVVDGIIVDKFSQLINPQIPIPQKVQELTGISNSLVENEPTIDEVIPKFYEFCKGSVLVAHNAGFDTNFIRRDMKRFNLNYDFAVLDTLTLARAIVKDIKRYNLTALSKKYGVSLVNAHRAVNDAQATAEVFIKMLKQIERDGYKTFDEINSLAKEIDPSILFESPISILIKNEVGLKNLYKLVSKSHMNYVNRVAKVPRSLINEYREGLLIGSGTSSSELYQAIFNMYDEDKIEEIASYYDYIEIQPIKNNLNNYFFNNLIKSEETLKEINCKLYNLGKKLNIPVVATGDVHYLEENDDIVRRIILNGITGRPPENYQLPQSLNFLTTDEMLKEFSYLGSDESYEVVVKNTNLIKDMIEDIKPIPDGTYTPVIEGSEKELSDMCYKRAREIYGDNLPEVVEKRLRRELDSIINNGYAVLYIIAQKLVKKSNDDGYVVGSRGSVGSSFAATMSGITEVNPLQPHYVCPNCKHSEFVDDVSVGSGVDLPPKKCPICGEELKRDGHNIPFEVFLGFNGDKEPDIDLNFAGEYQPIAHKYTEELFGEGYVFRAGTIGTVAEKTAYGYVRKYYENRNEEVSRAELDRLTLSAMGVKRTSGQHPGGVMICPRHKEIYDFTPIQYPADDKDSGVITTHFDYNFIHGKILKLDILGHDGPTIIRMLEDFTGVNSSEIPLDDKNTISLFSSAEKLNLDESIFTTNTGTLGIPEFGTGFVKQMLLETNPRNFSDLVRISGLSHGTDVWNNNAQLLVQKGDAKLPEVICTREDIMIYLLSAGAENKFAFDTMEKVRKGKGLTEEQISVMNTLPLPKWYIDSCQKIKYMFPKAHAVAYVMLSFRIAYFKLNYPLAYYSTYFTIKLQDFNGDIIVNGSDAIKTRLEELKSIEKLSAKEKGEINILEVALEMLARGYEFNKVDIYKSEASKFYIRDNKIQMPIRAITGIGEQVANNIVREREKGDFLSIEDLMRRTKSGNATVEILKKNKLLDFLPDTNQLNLFNMF